MITFEFKHFNELSNPELYDLLQLRAEIFVVEQTCIYNDLDGLDKEATHLIVKNDDEIIATSRLLKPGTRFPDFSIGRVVVKKAQRGKQLGEKMMKKAIQFMLAEWGAKTINVSAQKYLERFYSDLGFEIFTGDYLEDGIPHVGMRYKK
ncbi:ElaA protein [Tangfeifania diversioriginum]|uniref:ElaA protein n=1 Tax=Tangfeifania diversioriginum TaxID=1168035 RepID=A0A1M6KIK9_9BACT|nr:GNAT family N-acetyltransferase [Tangfeifania diversioriginum]SHJ58776.1 ElaA protein [Tangfeifania diversioriginum]